MVIKKLTEAKMKRIFVTKWKPIFKKYGPLLNKLSDADSLINDIGSHYGAEDKSNLSDEFEEFKNEFWFFWQFAIEELTTEWHEKYYDKHMAKHFSD